VPSLKIQGFFMPENRAEKFLISIFVSEYTVAQSTAILYLKKSRKNDEFIPRLEAYYQYIRS